MTSRTTIEARIGYGAGYDAGVAEVTAELTKRERPTRYARAELAKIRGTWRPGPLGRVLALRDDYGWGYRDGRAVTLANFLYRGDDVLG